MAHSGSTGAITCFDQSEHANSWAWVVLDLDYLFQLICQIYLGQSEETLYFIIFNVIRYLSPPCRYVQPSSWLTECNVFRKLVHAY